MRFLKQTNIDFLKPRKIAFALSGTVTGIGLVLLIFSGGPKLGIDFAGGSQIVVRFAEMPSLDQLRSELAAEGLAAATIQEFERGSSEVLIRTPGVEEGEQIDVAVTAVTAALDRIYGDGAREGMDLNTVGRERLLARVLETNPSGYDLDLDREAAVDFYGAEIGKALAARAEAGVLVSWEQLQESGIDAGVLDVVEGSSYLGAYAVVDSESVGPQVGRDLRRQAIQAIAWALVGMLAYITYRFEFKYGVAAVVALGHDVFVALTAFMITGREFNLPVIAAFLTIVGYSLNDTVIIFDRIRENSSAMRRVPMYERINTSINQTLSRTLLTSLTTLIVVVSLFLFGGPVINDFSFALLVGIFVGTYSTIYVASPIVYVWQQRELARRR